jgi:hypothetical protein
MRPTAAPSRGIAPDPLTAEVLALQRDAGNRTVGRCLSIQRLAGSEEQMKRLSTAIGVKKASWIRAHPIERVSAFLGRSPKVLAAFLAMPIEAFKAQFPMQVPAVADAPPTSAPSTASEPSEAVVKAPSEEAPTEVDAPALGGQPPVAVAEPAEQIITGKVANDGGRFYLQDPKRGKLWFTQDSAIGGLVAGMDVTYSLVHVNEFMTKAKLLGRGERPAATDVGSELRAQNDLRTAAVLAAGFVDGGTVALKGEPNVSGARKHYRDPNAVARSDAEVRDLLGRRLATLQVTKVEALADTFKIPLGGIMSIVGEIEYTDAPKTRARRVTVFHVGPSL